MLLLRLYHFPTSCTCSFFTMTLTRVWWESSEFRESWDCLYFLPRVFAALVIHFTSLFEVLSSTKSCLNYIFLKDINIALNVFLHLDDTFWRNQSILWPVFIFLRMSICSIAGCCASADICSIAGCCASADTRKRRLSFGSCLPVSTLYMHDCLDSFEN